MRKLHVFVNQKGEVIATGPAPSEITSKSSGPIFAGFSPAAGGDDLTAYEITVEDDFKLSRDNGNVEEYHARMTERIRATKDLKQIDFRKNFSFTDTRR